jgi:riboflavin kinase/FMN adenylyltransferase
MVFDPHPPRVLRPDKAPALLMTLDQKIEAFERAGIDAVAVVRFTTDLSRWEPELFVEAVLIDWLAAAEVWVGANFLFGRDRSGTVTLLRALGDDRGFRVQQIEPVRYKDFVVSSTRIRRLLDDGRVDEAGSLLGHYYFIDGLVVHGDGRGRTLGYPTANLRTENELVPARGIYTTVTLVDGRSHPSVSSIGVRPTVSVSGPLTIETHVLDANLSLYDRRLRLSFVKRLRGEMKFDSLEALRVQMDRDAAEARDLFARMAL